MYFYRQSVSFVKLWVVALSNYVAKGKDSFTSFSLLVYSLFNMPLLNLLVADGINQPFDDDDNKENYLSTLKSIINSHKEYGIQVIIISTDTNETIESTIKDVGVFYGIENGLNPLHE